MSNRKSSESLEKSRGPRQINVLLQPEIVDMLDDIRGVIGTDTPLTTVFSDLIKDAHLKYTPQILDGKKSRIIGNFTSLIEFRQGLEDICGHEAVAGLTTTEELQQEIARVELWPTPTTE